MISIISSLPELNSWQRILLCLFFEFSWTEIWSLYINYKYTTEAAIFIYLFSALAMWKSQLQLLVCFFESVNHISYIYNKWWCLCYEILKTISIKWHYCKFLSLNLTDIWFFYTLRRVWNRFLTWLSECTLRFQKTRLGERENSLAPRQVLPIVQEQQILQVHHQVQHPQLRRLIRLEMWYQCLPCLIVVVLRSL